MTQFTRQHEQGNTARAVAFAAARPNDGPGMALIDAMILPLVVLALVLLGAAGPLTT